MMDNLKLAADRLDSNLNFKIMVASGVSIGGLVHSFSVLEAFRQKYPMAHIELLTWPHYASLAQKCNVANIIQTMPANLTRASAEAYFARFDIMASCLAPGFLADVKRMLRVPETNPDLLPCWKWYLNGFGLDGAPPRITRSEER